MPKIIIHNESDIPDHQAIRFVSDVIQGGRISDGGKAYCWHSVYTNGNSDVQVVARPTSKTTDTFWIRGYEAQNNQ